MLNINKCLLDFVDAQMTGSLSVVLLRLSESQHVNEIILDCCMCQPESIQVKIYQGMFRWV